MLTSAVLVLVSVCTCNVCVCEVGVLVKVGIVNKVKAKVGAAGSMLGSMSVQIE